MVEDAIGLVILILLGLIVMVAVGLSILFSFDTLASSISWIGQGPSVGWLFLGGMGGALCGVIQGMKIRGKSDDLSRVYPGVAVIALLLLAAGVSSPAGRVLIGW